MQMGELSPADNFRVDDSGACRFVYVYGDIDGVNAPDFKLAVSGARGAVPVVVDLVYCSYIDSMGLGVLIAQVRQSPVTLVLTPACRIYRIFEVTGLLAHFTIVASTAEALAKLPQLPIRLRSEAPFASESHAAGRDSAALP